MDSNVFEDLTCIKMEVSQEDLTCIKMEVSQDDTESTQCNIFNQVCEDGSIPFEDEHEDTNTQIDGHTVYKSVPDVAGPDMEVPYENQNFSGTAILTTLDSQLMSSSPLLQGRRGNFYYKEKASNSLKSMKEKHRENERLRHHSLNQHLRDICKSVPGSAEDGKETKVVMMQRIISYMSYLENTIKSLCYQFSVKPNHRWTMLTSSLKDIERAGTWEKEFAATQSEDSEDSAVFPTSSLHLKLSSPTIDSTTDPATNDSVSSVLQPLSKITSPSELDCGLQDATVPSSPYMLPDAPDELVAIQDSEWGLPSNSVMASESETFDALLQSDVDFHQSLFEFTSVPMDGKLMDSPCEVQWLGSPEKSPVSLQCIANNFGIQCDPQGPEDQAPDIMHTLVVSPDKVIPSQLVGQPTNQNSEARSQAHVPRHNSSGIRHKVDVSTNSAEIPGSKTTSESNQVVPKSLAGLEKETLVSAAGNQVDDDMSFVSDDTQMFPLRSSKRKQSSPKRTPLFNISNVKLEVPSEFGEGLREASALIKKEISEFNQYSRGNSGLVYPASDVHAVVKEEFTESKSSLDVTDNTLEAECSKVLREASSAARSKLDLRKSSWMNGFMMFSRIHRKEFIRRNPGYHTAVISKLMGHAWRAMSSEEQQPYIDKAKVCAQELQKMLDANRQPINGS